MRRSVDSFLETKLHQPPVREEWVPRPRLVDQLERAVERPVVLIAAPAGYGKTTLVAQWLARHRAAGRAAAWVALDAGDNDPARLWTHVTAALQRAGRLDATEDVVPGLGDVRDEALRRMVSTLSSTSEECVILLDDFDVIREPRCHSQVELLIENLPPQAHLVIITRADPGLRLGRIRASGQLAEIRAEDLCFTSSEVVALTEIEGVRLSPEGVGLLVERTEGWPAGIYLACLALSGRPDPDEFVRQLSGGSRFIGDYFAEEVLSRDAETGEFVRSMSVVDRFTAPLCDAVLGKSGSARILRDLERDNLFLVPLDENRRWFRFHHLLAAVARAELESVDPDAVLDLHARAARWFRDNGYVDEAVRHSLSSGIPGEAADLVQANWLTYVDAGRARTVMGWLDALGSPSIAGEPAAGVTAAWMAALRGDEKALEAQLRALEEFADHGPLPDGSRSVRSAMAMIRGLFGFGGPAEMIACAQLAVELETDGQSPFFALARTARGHAAYVSGDLELAANMLEKASYNEAAPTMIRVLALSTLSLVEAERGRDERSADLARAAMQVVVEQGLRSAPQASLAFTALGRAQAAAGELDAAMATLEEGLILRRGNPGLSPWPTLHHLLVTGPVALSAGQLRLAEQLSDEASALLSGFRDDMGPMTERLRSVQHTISARRADAGTSYELTDRETDVLRLLQGPLTLNEIANQLHLSANTVKTHANAVYRKLGAHSRTEAVRRARERLLI